MQTSVRVALSLEALVATIIILDSSRDTYTSPFKLIDANTTKRTLPTTTAATTTTTTPLLVDENNEKKITSARGSSSEEVLRVQKSSTVATKQGLVSLGGPQSGGCSSDQKAWGQPSPKLLRRTGSGFRGTAKI